MIIDRNISKYLVDDADPIRHALGKIDLNEDGFVICVDDSGQLLGTLTDGDFRRWVISTANADLDRPVGVVINRDILYANVADSSEKMRGMLSDRIHFIPLVDNEGRCVAVVRPRKGVIDIGGRRIGAGNPVFLIAEIGNNHNGSLELAKRLVDEAVAAGADCAKFQMRHLAALYSNTGNANDSREDLGSQYTLDLLNRYQLPVDDLYRAFDYCHERGILPLCTAWDVESLEALERYGLAGYKAASADLTNHDLLDAFARTGKPLVCSTGMSTDSEIADAVALLRRRGAQFALLHCNSTYPAPFKDINLRYMSKLRQIGECPVGYSSHDRGINIVVAAVSLGAEIVEKHFTLDRSMEGNDHRISLLPAEFAEMATAVRQVEEALGAGGQRRLSQGEMMNRESLGKSLIATCDLAAGQVIEERMIAVRSPGRGLAPYRKHELVGKIARRALKRGESFFEADLGGRSSAPRAYRFRRPFGIPVRYHDLAGLAGLSNFDLLEFHLSYKDLEEDITPYFQDAWDMDLVVHAPELFARDHVLDLCALDPEYRSHSLRELARVIVLTRRLQEHFRRAERPRIIVNAGGFTQDAPLPTYARRERYEMVLESLAQLDTEGVEILPQTMPPFPWHFGGQRYQNLFMAPDETRDFCLAHGMRVCLDTSHSKLACNHHKWSFSEFVRTVGPHTAHLHIADAAGVDGEGLQVGEGEIDFAVLARDLDAAAPSASFIPEIWQGHKNGGEGFWQALERLEPYV